MKHSALRRRVNEEPTPSTRAAVRGVVAVRDFGSTCRVSVSWDLDLHVLERRAILGLPQEVEYCTTSGLRIVEEEPACRAASRNGPHAPESDGSIDVGEENRIGGSAKDH